MDIDFTEEQLMLAESLRRMLEDKSSIQVVRAMEGDGKGYPQDLWNIMADMGLAGLTVAEEYGGLGLGALEQAIVYEEFGRALTPVPHFVSSVLSAHLLANAGSEEQKRKWLPAITAGTAILTPAWLEPGNGYSEHGVQMSAGSNGNEYILNGTKFMVPFASSADRLIVLVRSGPNPTDIDLVLVDPKAAGISMVMQYTMAADPQYEVTFDNVKVPASARLGTTGKGWGHWQEALKTGMIALAAWGVGCGDRAIEMASEYASERVQFDKPIGSFQGIAHPLANAATRIAGARLLTLKAAWAHDDGRPFKQLATMAYLESGEASQEATKAAQNTFGGIGFTLDINIQLYFRRARQNQLSWGDAAELNEEIGAAILAG